MYKSYSLGKVTGGTKQKTEKTQKDAQDTEAAIHGASSVGPNKQILKKQLKL